MTIPEPTDLGEEARHTEAEPAVAFTPGPWQNGVGDCEGIVSVGPLAAVGDGNVICLPPPDQMEASFARWPANARLIAAAPDQHAACRETRAVFGELDLAKLHAEDSYLHAIVRHAMDTLDAAIAKATAPDRLNKMGRG